MAEVYWVRLPEHTDVFSQGYVGVTKNSASSRFRGHVQASKKEPSNKTILSKAILKYGRDGLVVTPLVKCELDYAYRLEEQLRPKEHIGWNIAKGGYFSGIYSGYKLSDETRAKMSAARKGVVVPPEIVAKVSVALKGRKNGPLTEESIVKRTVSHFYSIMERNPLPWASAELWYEFHEDGISGHNTEKLIGVQKGTLRAVFKAFDRGWVPKEDPKWIFRFKKEESSGS